MISAVLCGKSKIQPSGNSSSDVSRALCVCVKLRTTGFNTGDYNKVTAVEWQWSGTSRQRGRCMQMLRTTQEMVQPQEHLPVHEQGRPHGSSIVLDKTLDSLEL